MLQQNDWSDPRNKFPAVLFRLSYRTKESYRSGYRGRDAEYEGDDEERVIESMRGWWEMVPPDVLDLGVEYAVAFHKGRTRAVVKIDPDRRRWRWVDGLDGDGHHRMKVDEYDPQCPNGHIDDGHWRGRKRLRWSYGAERAPDKVWETWVGKGGKKIRGTRRDTLVSVWPYSLLDDERDLVERALRILGEVLQTQLVRQWGDRDLERLRNSLVEAAGGAEARRELGERPEQSSDPALWLKFILKQMTGNQMNERFPSIQRPSAFRPLLALRNRWAHFAYRRQVDDSDVGDLELMTRLLRDLEVSPAADTVGFIHRVLKAQAARRDASAAG